MKILFKLMAILVISNFFPLAVRAFPETSRHGYLSCTTCHFSPSGRGVLTPYGKTISHELYSYWRINNENEAVDAITPWWQIGGQARLLQYFADSKSVQKARFFPMQAELEGAIDKESWAVVASLGGWRPTSSETKGLRPYSRNHYGILRLSENWIVRLGHFRVNYGLGLPDHTLLINDSLGWTHSDETYNFELNFFNDDAAIQMTFVAPSQLLVTGQLLSGGTIGFDQLLFSSHKIGANIAQFRRDNIRENHAGLHAVITVSENSFLQTEWAYRAVESSPRLVQSANFIRYSYELPFKIRPLLQWESATLNQSQGKMAQRTYLGTEWFPIVNTDFILLAGKESSTELEDQVVVTLVGHFYF